MSCHGLLRLAILLATILAPVTVVLATDKEAATRIVDSKCLDYVNMVSTPHDIITLDLDSPVRQSYTLQCPLQNPYVVGGKAVQKDEFPHMVALGYVAPAFQRNNWKFQCGGTLISELFVLTAAHCINRDLRIARLGVVDVDDPDAQDFRIEEEIIHEEYSPTTKYNDLALLRLDRNVSITLHLRPACLATDRAERNRRATVTGWGKTGREGEPCRFQKGPGVCIGYSTCRPLLESLNGRISICSYNAREAVVCCPQDYQSQLQTLAAAQQSLTISAKKCIEYMRLATPTTIFSSLKPNAEVVQKKSKLCSNDNNLIVGGEAAKLGEFPHMGAIGYRNPDTGRVEFRCGATLISERFVLTAAHCRNADAVVVRLGDLDLESEADGADPRDFEIEEFIKHPEYTSRTKYNDIALVRLATPVQINSRIRPACLYQSKEIRQQKLIATGYGAMENFGSNANQLLKVVLDQYTQEACQQAYANDGRPLSRGIVDSQFCAGYEPGGRDTCQGDSGGPLQVRDEQDSCRFYVAAVTSFGKFCGTSTPGIYTRVGAYLGWIEQIVWGNGQSAV